MKIILTSLALLLSSSAFAVECDHSVNVPLSTDQIMANFDYYYDRQNECIPVSVKLQKNQICTAYVKVRMIEDPISDQPEFSITRCEPNKDIQP